MIIMLCPDNFFFFNNLCVAYGRLTQWSNNTIRMILVPGVWTYHYRATLNIHT